MSVNIRDVQTTLNYYVPTGDQIPYTYVEEPPAGIPKTNVSVTPHAAVVHDARGQLDAFGLDVSGFQWVEYPSAEKEFGDEVRIRGVYYAEVEVILKRYAGAKRVFVFDHKMRGRASLQTESGQTMVRGPAHRVHVDQTSEAAEELVRYHLLDDAERLLKGRYQIINVWRPIGNPVARDPLGVADFRTVDVAADLAPTRSLSLHRRDWMYSSVKYNPGHKWYCLSDQTPDEVTLIKCFDSDVDKARLAPHSAFPDETCPADAPQRQSIEVRALVFDRE